jgi:hypothetical protein
LTRSLLILTDRSRLPGDNIRGTAMRKIDQFFILIGLVVGGFLTWHSYYSNSHREAAKINELIYILLFPPSLGLMATENASEASQALIISIVVAANGAIYGLGSMIVRKVFK